MCKQLQFILSQFTSKFMINCKISLYKGFRSTIQDASKLLVGSAYIYIYIYIVSKKVKLLAVVEGDQEVPFSIATKPRCRGGCYSFPWIAPLYPWYLPYIAEC